MDITVKNLPVKSGIVEAPPSKSAAHRILICAALSSTPTKVHCRQTNDDMEATVSVLNALGADIKRFDWGFWVTPVKSIIKGQILNCLESGSTLRFMLPVAAALGADATFIGKGRLPSRPLSPLYELMSENGVAMSKKGEMPLVCQGKLLGGDFEIDGSVSSQFITGLLLAIPIISERGSVKITGELQSRPYIDITLKVLRAFGIRCEWQGSAVELSGRYSSPEEIFVEGDWSSAAFWLALGTLGKSSISVKGLDFSSPQGDRKICDMLTLMGADIRQEGTLVTAYPKALYGKVLNCADIPDLVPVLSVCAAFASGETVFENISRLRLKESDRVLAICEMLGSFGVKTKADESTLTVYGTLPNGSEINSFADHRIAMSGAVLALSSGCETLIKGAECISKSYPAFFSELEKLYK